MQKDPLPMQMSRLAYYGDFVWYALLVLLLALRPALSADWQLAGTWLLAALAGVGSWTLLEYVVHRFALHGLPFLSDMHAGHHVAPRALIGTPSWITTAVLMATIFLPLWRLCSLNVAGGFTAGVAFGYLCYGIMHHVLHHRRPRWLARRLVGSLHRHLCHHYADSAGNFGVTSPLWDFVFGTALEQRVPARLSGTGPKFSRARLLRWSPERARSG